MSELQELRNSKKTGKWQSRCQYAAKIPGEKEREEIVFKMRKPKKIANDIDLMDVALFLCLAALLLIAAGLAPDALREAIQGR